MAYGSITRFRKELFDIVGPQLDDDPYVILKQNEPVAVVLGVQEYRALIAAQRIFQNPEAVREIIAAHEDLEAGLGEGFYPLDTDPTVAEAGGEAAAELKELEITADSATAESESSEADEHKELLKAYSQARAG